MVGLLRQADASILFLAYWFTIGELLVGGTV